MHEHRMHVNTYKCYMCGQFVKSKSSLKTHYEFHVAKTHNCRYCEMSFLKIYELVEHYTTHTESDRNKTPVRILERRKYIERPEIPIVESDGRLRIYERIQNCWEIERKPYLFYQRIGDRLKTNNCFQDRLEDQYIEVPEYPTVIPDEIWEQRLTPQVIPMKRNFREEEEIVMEVEEDLNESVNDESIEGFKSDEGENSESENNNFVRMDDKILENLGQNKSLEEFDFFSTEDLFSNSKSSSICSSSEEELTVVSPESQELMDTLEDDSTYQEEFPCTSKFINNKSSKRKFLVKLKNKAIEAIKSPIPSYNEIID